MVTRPFQPQPVLGSSGLAPARACALGEAECGFQPNAAIRALPIGAATVSASAPAAHRQPVASVTRLIAVATGRLAGAAMLAKTVGMVDQMVISSAFGTGAAMDSYLVAQMVPVVLAIVLARAMEKSFVPLYVRASSRDPRAGADLLLGTVLWSGIGLGALGVTLPLAAPALLQLVAPGLDAPRLQMAAEMAPLIYPYFALYVVSTVLGSALNVVGRFGLGEATKAIVPAMMLVFVLAVVPWWGIWALALGQLVGYVVQAVVLVAFGRPLLHGASIRAALRAPELRELFVRAWPLLASASLTQINPLVDQIVISRLPAGYISAMGFALKLIDLPIVVLFSSLAAAALPFFSRCVAEDDMVGLKDSLRLWTWVSAVVCAVGTLVTFLVGRAAVGLVFERGAFSAESAELTTGALLAFSIGFAPMCIGFLVTGAYAVLGPAYRLTWLALGGVMLNLLLDLILVDQYRHVGVALATSLVYVAVLIGQIWLLRQRIGDLDLWRPPHELERAVVQLRHGCHRLGSPRRERAARRHE